MLVLTVDWREVVSHLQVLRWPAAILGLAVFAAQFPVCAWKWGQALRIHDLSWPVRELLPIHCSAFFFNNFFPSAIGGDGYRAYRTLPATGRSRAVSAVLLDRAVGFGAMLALACVGTVWLANSFAFARPLLIFSCVSGALGTLTVYGLYKGWFKVLAELLRRLPQFSVVDDNARLLLRRHPAWATLLAGAFSFQLLAAAWIYCVFTSIGVNIGWAECAIISAAAGVGSLLPISVGGLGVVEGSIAGMAVVFGVPYDLAVGAALLSRLGTIVVSVICGLVYLLERKRPVATAAPVASDKRAG